MARDELVQSAIDNWAPRFIANGIDANDFQRVTSSVERWDDWCRVWSECGAMHAQMGEKAEAQGYIYRQGITIFMHRWPTTSASFCSCISRKKCASRTITR